MKWTRLRGSLPCKAIAIVLSVLFACATVVAVVGIAACWDLSLYSQSESQRQADLLQSLSHSDAYWMVGQLRWQNDEKAVERFCQEQQLSVIITQRVGAPSDQTPGEGEGAPAPDAEQTLFRFGAPAADAYRWEVYHSDPNHPEGVEYLVTMSLPQPLVGKYLQAARLISAGYALRYWIYPLTLLFFAGFLTCFLFLLCAAGHRRDDEEIHPGPLTRVPLDLLTAALALSVFAALSLIYDSIYYSSDLLSVALIAAAIVVGIVLLIGYCMGLAVRVKRGRVLQNTVIFRLLRPVYRLLRAMGRGCKTLFLSLPLIWKTALITVLVCVVEFIAMLAFWWNREMLLFFWFVEKFFLLPVVLYVALCLRRLQKGSRQLAEGDLSHQVDTQYLLPDFREHAQNLNRIAEGMGRAVEQRMKSERMKTELITNVSHDIKTPLTSLINYSQLIEENYQDAQKVQEYAQVLARQSDKLRRLMENLVEASKATTGNVEVLLAPCQAEVLLSQTAGEYQNKLSEKNLMLMVSQPEQPLTILADGRHLWRVFDNLMNNVCKYALSGTRVYLELQREGNQAVFRLKNTSREPLNLSADELMERFVRGEGARSSEGNGLGLSIARSLTELQGGALTLTTDGDLFKAEIRFPLTQPPAAPQS